MLELSLTFPAGDEFDPRQLYMVLSASFMTALLLL